MYNLKMKTDKNPLNAISIVYLLSPLVYRKNFTDDYYLSGHFPWMDTI